MSTKLRISAYVILIALVIWFARGFHSNYSKLTAAGTDTSTNTATQTGSAIKSDNTNQPAPAMAQTNVNDLSTNNPASTNEAVGSNTVKQAVLATNATAAGDLPAKAASPSAGSAIIPESKQGKSVGYLVAFVGAIIGLGLLLAYDLTQLLGAKTVDLLFNDQGLGMRDPEYEQAEKTWVNGKHLEAIEMMRDYLKKHPREQYVALRIAEIYEKDLRNYVAASLEYEEVLKKKLPDERWGWGAIHLCNIYTKMGQPDKTRALLERIARDYPKTGAAKKARRNLGLPEPDEEPAPGEEAAETAEETNENGVQMFDLDEAIASTDEEAAAPPPEATPATPAPTDPAQPKLPPGFRRK
jgi:TolA-binding protein